MGVIDKVKGFLKGDRPVESVQEVGADVGAITGDVTEVPTTPIDAPVEPLISEIPESEPEPIPEDTTYASRSAKGKFKKPEPVTAPIEDLLKKNPAGEAEWKPKEKVEVKVNTAPDAVWTKKDEPVKSTPNVTSTGNVEEPYEGALKRGDITEDEALSYLKQQYGFSDDEAKKKIKSVLDSSTQKKSGVDKVIDEFADYPTDVTTDESKGMLGSLKDKLVQKTKNIKVKSTDDLLGNAVGNIKGETAPVGAGTDANYADAIKGGYSGPSRTSLDADIKSYNDTNISLQDQIEKIDKQIDKKNAQKEKITKLRDATKDPTLRAQYTSELSGIQQEIKLLDTQRQRLVDKVDANKEEIRKKKDKIDEYNKAVMAGKKTDSFKSKVREEMRDFSKRGMGLNSGVFSAGIDSKKDWFGKQGFLSQPFKQENITRSAVEPVKVSTRNLDYITRATGGSVGRSMIDVIPVKPNKNIAPMGAPGTIYGARQQFDYNIPVKRISLLEVSGVSKGGNVNPDILPSLYDVPKQAQLPEPQYKQVIQPDGTVTNVPVPVQQRKSKLFTVSVNRYPSGIRITGMRVHAVGKPVVKPVTSKPVKNDSRLVRGIESVGTVSNSGIAKLNFGSKSSNMNKLIHSVEGVGSSKVEKVIPDVKLAKKRFGLGMLNIKDSGLTVRDPTKKTEIIIEPIREYRKSKKDSSLVKMGLNITGVNLNKNLNKLTRKNKLN